MKCVSYKPYIFQSGKYQGRSVEEIIFVDPLYIGTLLGYKKDEKTSKNALQEHLEVLMNTIPESIVRCPFCGEKTVKYFLYLNNETVLKELVCCESLDCQKKLKNSHLNDYLLPFKLSSLLVFKKKTLRKKVISLFKMVLGLKGRNIPEKIFQLFFGVELVKENYQLKIDF